MEEKASVIIAKRRKKRVNGKINKFKKNVTAVGKYIRNTSVSKSSCKKTHLYTLFKSFIKPYNERNTAFYSILCIINNIYKCKYYLEHRCLICKAYYEKKENDRKNENEDTEKYIRSDDPFRSNVFSVICDNISNDNTFPNSFSLNCRYNKNINVIKNNYMNIERTGSVTFENVITTTTNTIPNNVNKVNNVKVQEKCTKFSTVSGVKSERHISPNSATKTAAMINVSSKTKINMQHVCTSLISQGSRNKFHFLPNINENYFLSYEKLISSDIYNFDLFQNINAHDKILLDLNQNEIHPNILRAGIFFNKYSQTTHNHRNVDLLIALKNFIRDYTLPPYEPINKHMKIAIDKEINYIIMCKKHSVSMGEVIRWFKCTISNHVGKGVLEETKKIIIHKINNYIRTKIITPSIFISNFTSENIIQNKDVILIYTFDYVVYLSILKAVKKGKTFEIVIVDSEPYKNTNNVKLYTKLGLTVTYTLISGLAYFIKRCTKLILGIDAVIHNSVYADVGTSIICMVANIFNVETYIICETYKISNKIIIDSFNMNNINNNLDIYDYIYLHHHHHVKTSSFSTEKKKNIEHYTEFNKKLNTFINSFSDIEMDTILFSSIKQNKKPIIRYAKDLKRNRKKNEKKKNTIINTKKKSFFSNEKREEKKNEFMKECEEKKIDKDLLINDEFTMENGFDLQYEKNEMNDSSSKRRKKSEKKDLQKEYIKSIGIEGIKKKKDKDDNNKNRNSGQKELNSVLCGIYSNTDIVEKTFLNIKDKKNTIPVLNFQMNFTNHFDSKKFSMKNITEHNEIFEDNIFCNNVCNSICKRIGDVKIKNVCTDKFSETNLFSSVSSHIHKINTNIDKSFYVANICNDITPLKYINYIITEVGIYRSVNKNALKVYLQNV